MNKISVYLSGENNFFLAPFYLFLKESFSIWLSKIDSFVDSGNVKCYAEDALNEITEDIQIKPLYYEDEICMEIDSKKDLEKARALLQIKSDSA